MNCKKKKKKLINRNLTIRRLHWAVLTASDDNTAQQEEERLLFFPGKDSDMRSHGLIVYYRLPYPDFLSSLRVLLPLPCVETCTWHSVLADHELQLS